MLGHNITLFFVVTTLLLCLSLSAAVDSLRHWWGAYHSHISDGLSAWLCGSFSELKVQSRRSRCRVGTSCRKWDREEGDLYDTKGVVTWPLDKLYTWNLSLLLSICPEEDYELWFIQDLMKSCFFFVFFYNNHHPWCSFLDCQQKKNGLSDGTVSYLFYFIVLFH